MSELKSVYSLSICGRLTLELHSLNNEGGEGNQTLTRTVAVVDTQGNVHKVNAISGDMFKHIQAEHFYLLARELAMPLCEGCSQFKAERALSDSRFTKSKLPKTDQEAIDFLLEVCTLEDTEGTLIAPRGSNRSVPRKSVAEFSWVVGLPDKVRTESYFHVRYASERGGEDIEQPIFHRPASSGVYASVANFELARIGFNDISQTYVIEEAARLQRYQTFLKSVLYTYVEPSGAMRNTQNPHIYNFEGVVTVSYGILPAPTISPLVDDYKEQVQQIAQVLDGSGQLAVHPFANTGQFAGIMQQIIAETKPYRLFDRQGG
jgi:CRISPR-associated protein Cst2